MLKNGAPLTKDLYILCQGIISLKAVGVSLNLWYGPGLDQFNIFYLSVTIRFLNKEHVGFYNTHLFSLCQL